MRRFFLILFVSLPVVVAFGLGADWLITIPKDAQATYVGRQTCAQCHAAQEKLWTGSAHQRALALATPRSVLGNFDNQELAYQGVTSKMFRRGERYFVRTDGPDGSLADFQVKYVIGYDPLQQYMVEFPDGRVQVLRISWDTKRRRWFYLYPPDAANEHIKPDDPLHWTGAAMNWNHMCAECHSTNLQKNFNLSEHKYHTTFSEIEVSCEACHGPGSIHVKIASRRGPFWDRNHGYGLAQLKGGTSKNEIEACAMCHSRRHSVHPDFRPGTELLDYYAPQMLAQHVYHADGQVLDEDYEYGSFLQSKMFAGGIRCTNCHDPHSAQLLHTGNELCTSCHQHPQAKYDVPSHHHHALGSAGAKCVNCHMPTTHYMLVDSRRDHGLRVPRPDLSVALGTPNACTGCHLEMEKAGGPRIDSGRLKPIPAAAALAGDHPRHEAKSEVGGRRSEVGGRRSEVGGRRLEVGGRRTEIPPKYYADYLRAAQAGDVAAAGDIKRLDGWAQKTVGQWYGPRHDPTPHFALALGAAWRHRPGAEAALIKVARRPIYPAIVRATAVTQLAQYDGQLASEAITASLADPEPLVRAAAIGAVTTRQTDPETWVALLAPLMKDPVRLVRTEAAQSLSPLHDHLTAEDRKSFDQAIAEFREGQLANNDQAASHMNLGSLNEALGRAGEAEQEYLAATRLDRRFFPAQFSLALLYSKQGKKDRSEKLLRGIVKDIGAMTDPQHLLRPVLVDAKYMLGLLLNEDPARTAEAEQSLLAAYELDRSRGDVQYALATFFYEHKKWDQAERFTKQLIALSPNDPRLPILLQQIDEARMGAEGK